MSFARLLASGRSMVGMKNAHSPYRMRAENLLPKFESTKNPFAPAPKVEAPKAELISATVATPSGVKVAPMETYPLFDSQLKPAVACATIADVPQVIPVAEAVRPVLETQQRRMPHAEVTVGLMDTHPLGLKTGAPRLETLPAPVVVQPKAPAKQPTISAPVKQPAPVQDREAARVAVNESVAEGKKFGWLTPLIGRLRPGFRPAKADVRKAVQTELSLDRVKVVRNDLSDADLEVVTIRRSEPTAGKSGLRLPPLAETDTRGLSRIASRIFGAGQSLVR